MKIKNILAALFLLVAGLQTVWSQGVMIYKGGDYQYYQTSDIDSIVFVNKDPISNIVDGHRYVDLGLSSGTLWATCNVGSATPNDYGSYFAWGEHFEKGEYLPDNYYYVTPYNTHNLYLQDDPAYLYWGGKWRTPSKRQIQELMEECEWTWEKYLGTLGSRVIEPNGNSIFLPAGSYKSLDFFNKPDTAEYGSYWGREYEFLNGGETCATELTFGVKGLNNNEPGKFFKEFGVCGLCYCGRNIRPVYDDGIDYVSQLLSNKWSGEQYTALAISYDSGVDYGEWNESSPNYNRIIGTPDMDTNFRQWYDIDYELTNNSSQWHEVQAPINNWCEHFGDIYIRREFYFDTQLSERMYLACGHDDAPCEYYLNGTLIWSVQDGWNNEEVIELSASQIALLKPGEKNVLAFHVHQNWGGMYADCGLYERKLIPNQIPKVFLRSLSDIP